MNQASDYLWDVPLQGTKNLSLEWRDQSAWTILLYSIQDCGFYWQQYDVHMMLKTAIGSENYNDTDNNHIMTLIVRI